MWTILGTIAAVAVALSFFRGANAVWGGLTIGLLIGVIIAIVYTLMGAGFHWSTVAKSGIVGALFGTVSDVLPVTRK